MEVHLEISGKKPILFLDEIQNIKGWEKFARRMADMMLFISITKKLKLCLHGNGFLIETRKPSKNVGIWFGHANNLV